MRRDGRLSPGDHYIFATGNLGGPVVYDIDAIRKTLAERTIAAVRKHETQRKAELKDARAHRNLWRRRPPQKRGGMSHAPLEEQSLPHLRQDERQ